MINYNSETETLKSWMNAVFETLNQIKKSNTEIFNSTYKIKAEDIDISLIQKNEQTDKLQEDTVSFARETMSQQDFDEQFPSCYSIRFNYTGNLNTTDNVRMFTVHQSSFIHFYEYFHFQKNMGLEQSITVAANKIYLNYMNWVIAYFSY